MLKSTEIILEQLIIGLLTMVIVDLFVWGTPLPRLESGGGAYQSFFYGVLIVIAAYAAGIVVDRWSDTLLEQLERRVRIKVYLNHTTENQFIWLHRVSLPNEPSIRLEIKKNGDRVADHHDYLRRRMRIARSLACLMPALFLALALLDYRCHSQKVMRWWVGGGTFAYYAIFLVISIFLEKIFSRKIFNKKLDLKRYLVPKTHPKEVLRKYVKKNKSPDISFDDEILTRFRFGYYFDPACMGLSLFALLGTALLFGLKFYFSPIPWVRFFLFWGGLGVTYLVGWAWWRISKTFFTFIQQYDEFGRKKAAPRWFVS